MCAAHLAWAASRVECADGHDAADRVGDAFRREGKRSPEGCRCGGDDGRLRSAVVTVVDGGRRRAAVLAEPRNVAQRSAERRVNHRGNKGRIKRPLLVMQTGVTAQGRGTAALATQAGCSPVRS